MERNQVGLSELLDENTKASEYYDSMHPVVQHRLREGADEISTLEDLYAYANNAMTDVLEDFNDIYQDSDSYPN